jgi:hypothetical protein
MRYFLISIAIAVIALVAIIGDVQSAGLENPRKSSCRCSRLVSEGVVPDTLNKLTSTFTSPLINATIDRLAVEVKAILSQFGIPSKQRTVEVKIPSKSKKSKSRPRAKKKRKKKIKSKK